MSWQRKDKLSLSFDCKTVSLVYPDQDEYQIYLQYVFDEKEYDKLYNFFHAYDCVVDIDTHVGMCADAIRISFSYDTPDETIREICNKAIEMMWNEYEPINIYGYTEHYENGECVHETEGYGFRDENGNMTWYDGYQPYNDEFHISHIFEYDDVNSKYGKEIM